MRAARRYFEHRPRVSGVVAVVALAVSAWWVLWAPVPHGWLLFRLTTNHGIDFSDLASIPFLVLVAWLLWPAARRGPGSPSMPKVGGDGRTKTPPGR